MNKKMAFLFPGQGAQYVGMGKDFYDHFSISRETFEEASDLLGFNFSTLIFEGPEPELTLTKNSQTAIYITSIAILRALQKEFPHLQPSVCAGLSLGEYTALTASKRLSFKDGLALVKARGQYMNDACEAAPGTMMVVLGLDVETVQKALQEISVDAWIANLNCPGQIVIAGTREGLAKASEQIKSKGAKRVLPLEVSGAFHSKLMQSAQKRLSPQIAETPLSESSIDIVMNVPGDFVSSQQEVREFLVQQVTSPVYWEKGVRSMMQRGIELYIEIGCGKTLSGMNKKIGVQEPTVSIEKVADFEEFIKLQESLCISC